MDKLGFQNELNSVMMLINGDAVSFELKEKLMVELIEKVHPYAISKYKKGGYITEIEIDGKRKWRKRKTKKELYQFLMEFYGLSEDNNSITFAELFNEWIEYKKQYLNVQNSKLSLSQSTIRRYRRDYDNHIAKMDIINKKIDKITPVMLEKALCDMIRNDELKSKMVKNIMGYLNQCFDYAYRSDYIKGNIMDKVDKRLIYANAITDKVKEDEKRVLNIDEMTMFKKAVLKHEVDSPNYMPSYAIELALMTGMRVGELAALHWTDIDDKYINVDYSEHRIDYDDKPCEIVIDEPKYRKHRKIPITNDMRTLFGKMKALNQTNKDSFIFCRITGERYTAHDISCACARRGVDAGIDKTVSIHTIRRTVSSMLNDVLSRVEVASIMGHTEETNKEHYDYSHLNYEQKISALSSVSSKVINFEYQKRGYFKAKKIAEAL